MVSVQKNKKKLAYNKYYITFISLLLSLHVTGDKVDTGNPCEICQCGKTGSLICAMIDCEPCHGRREAVEGLCCGKCFPGEVDVMPQDGCVKNGVIYEFGK